MVRRLLLNPEFGCSSQHPLLTSIVKSRFTQLVINTRTARTHSIKEWPFFIYYLCLTQIFFSFFCYPIILAVVRDLGRCGEKNSSSNLVSRGFVTVWSYIVRHLFWIRFDLSISVAISYFSFFIGKRGIDYLKFR